MTLPRGLIVLSAVVVLGGSVDAVTLPGGGPKTTDCRLELMANGLGFPGGRAFKGSTCADGDVCDADGVRNGSCLYTPLVCINATDPALPKCGAAQVTGVRFKGKRGKKSIDTTALDAAVSGLGLPSSASACSAPVEIAVAVGGPDKKGALVRGSVELRAKAKSTKGTDKDEFKLVCLPSVGPQQTTTTSSSSSTIGTGLTTTSTLPAGVPGAGLQATITGATIGTGGVVAVTFRLTDTNGVAIVPRTGSTSNPNEARVRFTIARIEVHVAAVTGEQFTTTFTKYVNYITGSAAGGNQPTYDSNNSPDAFVLVDAATGTWTYTFGRTLPAGFPTDLTHTVGGQVERTVAGERLIANPLFSFVPNASAVTTVRQDVTTAQCNACHNPLEAHGGARREVGLCQLCHTDQAIDPDTGNTIDFKQMVHRLHRGKDLPTVTDGAVGAKYSIIGFGGSEVVFGEKVKACVNGPVASAPCTVDADCSGGTCTGTTTVGVGFPQDLRNCTKCHQEGPGGGATAANYRKLPSVYACTGCHDDVNPGSTEEGFDGFNGLAAGTGHVAEQQPEALCRVCHKEAQDNEFDITVPGAHVIPARSATLAGISAEIVAASGTPNNPVQVQFRLRDGAGNPLTSFAAFNRIGFAISGSTVDYGGSATTPLITPTAFGGGATGTLVGPDGSGLATYTTATNLPGDAVGTWTIGLEARRPATVNGQTVNEAPQNVVKDFSVDGSAVAARRTVVSADNCASCHGTFSKDFSIHGNLRNRPEYCVVCHNAKTTDFARRKPQIANGADPANQTIAFKHLIHKIHRGEQLEQQPYIIYGFGGAVDFGDVLFPGDLRDCDSCHTGGSQFLPLPAGVLKTNVTSIVGGNETLVATTPPVQDACLACHDSAAAAAHAETNTTGSGAEACAVCHGEGAVAAVSTVHAPEP